jgi:predicted nucleic acid-binding protein
VLIAARPSRDQDHDRARRIANAFDAGDLPTGIVLSDVLEEILDYLQARSTPAVAVETLDAVIESRGFELVYTPKADFVAGRSLFRTHDRLSLTDGVIAASMDRRGIEYLHSFDDGFDSVGGVTRLVTAANPFE